MESINVRLQETSGSPAQSSSRAQIGEDEKLWGQFAEARSLEAFCESWLGLQCRMIDGVSSGLILLGSPDRGPFSPVAIWPDRRRNVKYLSGAAERAIAERKGLLLRHPQDTNGNQPERYDIAYPLEISGRMHGVVVLDVSPRPIEQLQQSLRHLHWGCGWLEVIFHRDHIGKDAAVQERLETALDAVATALAPDRFSEAATALVTALANRFGCDRVSLGVMIGGRLHIRALSDNARFNRKTDLLRTIASAMEEALEQRSTVVIPAASDTGTQITRSHEDLARRYGANVICSIPLSSQNKIMGVLTLERAGGESFDKQTMELCEAISSLAGPIIDLKYRDDRWLAVKASDSVRQVLTKIFGAGHLALKLAVIAGTAIVGFLFTATGDFRVTAKAVLEGEVQQAAVAPFQGYLETAPVRAGDVVQAGQVLATLQDRDLKVERLKHLNEQAQLMKEYRKALAERDAAATEIISAQLGQVEAQLVLATEKLRRTKILTPMAGIVVTGDLSQKLGSPVDEGDALFEIAPLDRYRIVLEVDERDISYLSVGQVGQLMLSSLPDDRFKFDVAKVTPVSAAREGRNFFRVEGRFNETPKQLRPAMEGVGKVHIDQRLLAWIWTHEAIDWLRLKLWTWLP